MIISNLHRNYCFLFVNFIKYLYVVQQILMLWAGFLSISFCLISFFLSQVVKSCRT